MAHSSEFQPTAPALDPLLPQSTEGMRASSELSAKCCCGRPQCAYLEHNDAALRGLEQDLQSAAQIGQALLARHENYMAEAEEDRRKMGATVDRLEEEKRVLEASNARTIEENRYLLDQLEELNDTVSNADAQIVSLNTTLQSTMKELDRLTALAAQTSHLEKQLALLESEQHNLLEKIGSKEDSEKSAIQRWKNAERMVNALQEQVERIEREAREDRSRHTEVVARFDRRRMVEKELEDAAGRLKGAAAAKGMGKEESSGVISHFVKDILQDNANLQLGIVELRDMLMGSNEEVENLREQMILHQPMFPDVGEATNAGTAKSPFLDNELARTPTIEAVPDFHVHHHYHAAPKDESKKPLLLRRPKKRRNITSPGLRTPSSGTQTPQTATSNPFRLATTSSAATILAQTSVTIPPQSHTSHAHNWSMSQAPSSAAVSSIPNSPVFDGMSDVPDSSRPTTPGSMCLGSPQFSPRHFKRETEVSDFNLSLGQNTSYSISGILHGKSQEEYDEPHFSVMDRNTIPEEPEDDSLAMRPSTKDMTEEYDPTRLIRPSLHRASSHESLLSSRGLDIPKIRSKPSTRFLSGSRHSLGTPISSGVAITSATAATAHRSKAPRGFDSKSSYNNLLSASNMSTSPPSVSDKSLLGKRVGALGGWITGRWGVAPMPATAEGVTSPTTSVFSKASAESKEGGTVSLSVQQTQKTTQNHHRQSSSEDGHGGKVNESAARRRADNRLSTHIEPVHLNDSLLQESLSEERVPTMKTAAAAAAAIETAGTGANTGDKPELRRGKKKAVNRLSTHVEAVAVDGDGLAAALGSL